jgi:hypothetical protein
LYTIPASIRTLAATIIPIAIPAFLLPLIPSPDESSVPSSTPMWFIELESSGEGAGDEFEVIGIEGDGGGGNETTGELAGG